MSALIQQAPPHVGPVIRVVGPVIPVEVPLRSAAGPVVPVHSVPVRSAAGPVVPVHSVPVRSAAGPVVPVHSVPVCSVVGPVVPVAVPVHSAVGPVVPVAVPVIQGFGQSVQWRASHSSGGASRSSVFASPVGGSSEDGGITTHMGIKEIAGKSCSIQKKKKLPTQVALDAEGLLRTDFPFDQISARQKLRTLNTPYIISSTPEEEDNGRLDC